MSAPFSTVIITRNEGKRIKAVIQSALQVSEDVIIVDSGSTDDTLTIAANMGVKTYSTSWIGYGPNKNYGIEKAKNDWIISIDGDEILSDQLINSINNLEPLPNHIYRVNTMVNYIGKWIKYSGWYPKWKNRIFNREEVLWDNSSVHEDLEPLNNKLFVKLEGHLLHYSYDSMEEHRSKAIEYAQLKAEKLKASGQQPRWIKKWFGPIFSFLKTYIFQLGILDGRYGWNIARMNALMVIKEVEFFENLKENTEL